MHIHHLDPWAAAFIIIGYLGFVAQYQMTVSAEGRASRAGKSMNFLQVVFVLCAATSYLIQFLPDNVSSLRNLEGWLLAAASIALFVSGCGIRVGRAMNYEAVLRENDRLRAEAKQASRD